jgi:hypothetical protein
LSQNVAVGEIDAVVLADVTEALARECGIVADFASHVCWDVAEVVTVRSEYLDGVWVVFVSWLWFQGALKLAKVVVDIVTVGHSCDIELYYIKLVIVFWPDGDVIAFVFFAEVFEFLDGRVRVTVTDNDFYFRIFDRGSIIVEQVEVHGL